MLRKLWCFVLCIVLHSISTSPTPNVKLPPASKWPSLITSKSGSPVVPRLDVLKSAFTDPKSKLKKLDFKRIKTKSETRRDDDCKNNIRELEADIILNAENDTIEVFKNVKEHPNKTEAESDSKMKKNIQQPVPSFIPIFRKRKPKRPKKPLQLKPENINSTTTAFNLADDEDNVGNYVKNRDGKGNFDKNDKYDKSKFRLIPFYSLRPNAHPQNTITTASQVYNEAPSIELIEAKLPIDLSKTKPNNEYLGNSVAENGTPIQTFSSNNILVNNLFESSIETNTVPPNVLVSTNVSAPEKNVFQTTKSNDANNISESALPIPNSENSIPIPTMLNNDPSFTNSPKTIPENTILFYGMPVITASENDIDRMGVHTVVPTNTEYPALTHTPQDIIVPLNNFIKNNFPANVGNLNMVIPSMVHLNTNPGNMIPKNIGPSIKLNMIPTSADPANNRPVNTVQVIEPQKTISTSTNTCENEKIITVKKEILEPFSIVSANTTPNPAVILDELTAKGIFSLLLNKPSNQLPSNIELNLANNNIPFNNIQVTPGSEKATSSKIIPNENIVKVKKENLSPINTVSANATSKPAMLTELSTNGIISLLLNTLSKQLPPNIEINPASNITVNTVQVKSGSDKSIPTKPVPNENIVIVRKENLSPLTVVLSNANPKSAIANEFSTNGLLSLLLNTPSNHFFPNLKTIPSNNIPGSVNTVQVKSGSDKTVFTKPVPNENIVIVKKENLSPLTAALANAAPKLAIQSEWATNGIFPLLLNTPLNQFPPNIEISPVNNIPVNTLQVKSESDKTISTKTVPNKNRIIVKKENLPLATVSNTAPKQTITVNELPANGRFYLPSNTPLSLFSSSPNIELNNVPGIPSQPIKENKEKSGFDQKKADLVIYKPEDVSLLNVEGDILKKVTMTVLVPMYVSKLDL